MVLPLAGPSGQVGARSHLRALTLARTHTPPTGSSARLRSLCAPPQWHLWRAPPPPNLTSWPPAHDCESCTRPATIGAGHRTFELEDDGRWPIWANKSGADNHRAHYCWRAHLSAGAQRHSCAPLLGPLATAVGDKSNHGNAPDEWRRKDTRGRRQKWWRRAAGPLSVCVCVVWTRGARTHMLASPQCAAPANAAGPPHQARGRAVGQFRNQQPNEQQGTHVRAPKVGGRPAGGRRARTHTHMCRALLARAGQK